MSASAILDVLIANKDLCFRIVYDEYSADELCGPLSCPKPEDGLFDLRVWFIAKMTVESDINEITDTTTK